APTVITLTLRLAAHRESIEVKGDAPQPVMGAVKPNAPVSVTREVIDTSMLPNSQYDDALALLPNVVRAPDGSLSVAGARPAQGALFVNGFNLTDPVSGQPALIIPLEAVDSMDVFTGGYSADLGRATAGVTSVHTRAGGDQFHSAVSSFVPRLHWDDGHVRGLQYWEPNLGLSGALVKGRAHFEQAFSYRFDRNPIETLEGTEDQKFDAVTSWTQVDVEVSEDQHLVFSASANPQHTDHANMTAFTPALTTPRIDRSAYAASAADRVTLGHRATLELRMDAVRTNLSVSPGNTGDYMVGHETASGGYFDRQNLQGWRGEGAAVWSSTLGAGNFLRAGVSMGRDTLDGADAPQSVFLLRSDGTVSRAISFAGNGALDASAIESTAFVQDSWQASRALTIDAGLRSDRTTGVGLTLSPRLSWTLKLPGGRSTLAGSAGRYSDKLALEAQAFGSLPSRVVETYDAGGVASGGPMLFRNAIIGGLRTPVATRWDLEFDERLSSSWNFRARYQERRGSHEPIVEPLALSPSSGVMGLESIGTSSARSLEATVGYRTPAGRAEVYGSYVRETTRGDLNSFDVVEGMLREPFVQPNQVGPLPADVPHRLLLWGIVRLPHRFTVAPFLEARSGFPYAAIDDTWQFVGARNSLRYPWYGSLDMYVNRIVGLPWHLPDARVGLKIYSIASAHTERDVQRDIASPNFGATYNPVPRFYSAVFELLWGRK
ncbi:MAG: TonB-dependent receptor plug domain-containing protein, partial [Bacteroidales bacterium]